MTVPSAIEYILVTSGVEGREEDGGKGMCMVRKRKTPNKEKVEVCIRVNRLVLPEGGERKRNLTTTGLGEKQRK